MKILVVPTAVNFVYVLVLRAVQYGNNWMKKILRGADLAVREIFGIQLFPRLDSI